MQTDASQNYRVLMPKTLLRRFLPERLKKGWEMYAEGALSGISFQNGVHGCQVSEGPVPYECVFLDKPLKKEEKLHKIGTCTCEFGFKKLPCEHLAAFLFFLHQRPPHNFLISRGFEKSLLKDLCLSLLRAYSSSHPHFFMVRDCDEHSEELLFSGKNGETLAQLKMPKWFCRPVWTPGWKSPGAAELREVVQPLLEKNWEFDHASYKNQLYGNKLQMEFSAENQKLLKLTPRAGTLQLKFGLLGEIFRQVYLLASDWTGTIEALEGGKKSKLVLSANYREKPLKIEARVPADTAQIIKKHHSEKISLGKGFALDQKPWRKRLKLEVNAEGGINVTTHAVSPDGKKEVALIENQSQAGFGQARQIPGHGFRKIDVPEVSLFRRFLGWKKYTIAHDEVLPFLRKYSGQWSENEDIIVDSILANSDQKAGLDRFSLNVLEKKSKAYICTFTLHYNEFIVDSKHFSKELREKRQMLLTQKGWVDFSETEYTWLSTLCKNGKNKQGLIELTRGQMLRLLSIFSFCECELKADGFPELSATPEKPVDDETQPIYAVSTNGYSLRPYQKQGLSWLSALTSSGLSGILADDMGLGKTHQLMALMSERKKTAKEGKRKFLVICPTSVVYHWQEKLKAFYPDLRALVYSGSNRRASDLYDNPDVIITNYAIVRRDAVILEKIDYDLILLDEAQHVKNRNTESYREISKFRCGSWFAVTGTPLENSPWDVKNIFDLILPGYFPGESEFEKTVVEPFQDPRYRSDATAAFFRMLGPFLLRRTKQQVLRDLPEKVEEIYKCEMTESQRSKYEACFNQGALPLLQNFRSSPANVSTMHIFKVLNQLKQICNHPFSPGSEDIDSEMFSDETGGGKWQTFRELLHDALESGQKIVVFSQYLQMLRIINQYLTRQQIDHEILTGSTKDRKTPVHRFNQDDKCKVFCCSLLAGGAGIDLTGGAVVIHYDRWWTAAKENQATDRVHRIGQHNNVQVIKFITRNSIEERIDEVISRKAEQMEGFIDKAGDSVSRLLSKENLIEVLESSFRSETTVSKL